MQIEEEFALCARGRIGAGGSNRDIFMVRSAICGLGQACAVAGGLVSEMFARADDSEAFVVEQALDFKNSFDVLATIETMAAGAFYRLKRGEFGFPIAQDKSFCGG